MHWKYTSKIEIMTLILRVTNQAKLAVTGVSKPNLLRIKPASIGR